MTHKEEAKQRAKNYMRLKGALEPKQKTLTLTLNKESVQGLLECLTHTSASGASLDVGEKIEKELVDFINDNK